MASYISTGKAAKLCGVTPDTVLKWIKKGKIEVKRTAGGHFRVSKDSLTPYIVTHKNPVLENTVAEPGSITYCRTVFAGGGYKPSGCRSCAVFESLAERCSTSASIGTGIPSGSIVCTSVCSDCEYFEYINKPHPNVLVITDKERFIYTLSCEKSSNIIRKFSCSEYETATLVQDFHPDFIVIDDTMNDFDADVIQRYLFRDSRIRGARIILAVGGRIEYASDYICAYIALPFNTSDLERCIGTLNARLRESEYHDQSTFNG